MSPRLRQAFHEALDLVLDAMAEEQRGTPPAPAKRARKRVERVYPMPENVTEEELRAGREMARRMVG